MRVEYILEEKDFLDHQLYGASRSNNIKKKRQKSRVRIPIVYMILSLVTIYNQIVYMSVGLIVFAVLWFFLYPLWEKQRYINHYKAFIKENYKGRINRNVTLEINEEYIIGKDGESESKVVTKEIERIDEIPSEIFIKLKTGQSFILPKDKIKDLPGLITQLKELAAGLKVEYNAENNWEWK